MATTTETVLLQVDIQANNNRLVEIQKQLNDTKTAAKELEKAYKENRISADELAAGQVRLRQQSANLTGEAKVLTQANEAQKKSNDASKGSINQLRAELAKGTAAYNAMSEAERDNTEAGQRLQAQNKALSDRLKELEGRIGDNRRSVGSYKESLKEAIKESGFLGGVTSKLADAQGKATAALNIAKAAIGGNVTALGLLRLALIATGIGAIVVVLGSLVAFLTKSQAGVDLMNRKLAGLKAVIGLVVGVASEFGETLFNALSNPKQAISDLVDFIETNLLNRLKAVGIIINGITSGNINKLSEGLFQLSTGVTDVTGKLGKFAAQALAAAKAGEAIEAESQRILRAERALNVERSQSRARIEELKKLSDDSTKSVAVRIQAAKTAAAIENRLLATQLKLQAQKIQNTIRESLLDKQQTNDELDAIAELRAARADTQQESLTLQTELQNKINSLNTEAAAATEARRKALDEAKLKEIEAEIAADKAAEDAAKAKLDQDIKSIQVKTAAEEKARADKLAADKAAYDADLAMLTRNLDDRRLKLETDYAQGLIAKEDFENRQRLIEEGGFAARLLLANKYNQDTDKADKELQRKRNERAAELTQKQREEYKKQVDLGRAFGETVGALISDTLTQQGATIEQFFGKLLIVVLDTIEKQLIATQIAAISEATIQSLSGADSVATYGAAGFAKAAFLAAAITAAFEVAKAGIAAGTSGGGNQFERGGIIEGPRHSQGGVPFTVAGRAGFEAEGGEAIMTRGAVQKFAPLLSYLNVAGGGRPFHYANGGMLPAPQQIDGGLMARQIGNSPAIDYDALANALSKQPIYTSVRDIDNAQGRRNKVVARARL